MPTLSPNECWPAVFLDRDGTLMPDVDYCGRPEDVHVFADASEALQRLKQAGYKIVVITNQSGIGRGYFTEAEYRAVEREVERQLGADLVDATYFCPDLPESDSPRRKPQPGMIVEAERELQLDLPRSYLIGDKASDAECGRNAGVRTILLQTAADPLMPARSADWTVSNLREAADLILGDGI